MRRRGARAKRREAWQLAAGIGLLVTALAVVIGVFYFQATRAKPLDQVTLCPADGPKGHTVLLVDRTDPLNFTQRQAFSVAMNELVAEKVPEGHMLSIFVLGESFQRSAEPLVELCNPGSEVGKSEMSANLTRLRRQYEERFIMPLQEATKALVADAPAKTSPVFEMLQIVAINGFRKRGVAGPRRLVLVSDMLHNTAEFSMYRGQLDFDAFEAIDYGKKAQADLKGVIVELHYLMTTPRLQTRRNLAFWERYFERAGARLIDVRRVEG